jgi:hypothetical protein
VPHHIGGLAADAERQDRHLRARLQFLGFR